MGGLWPELAWLYTKPTLLCSLTGLASKLKRKDSLALKLRSRPSQSELEARNILPSKLAIIQPFLKMQCKKWVFLPEHVTNAEIDTLENNQRQTELQVTVGFQSLFVQIPQTSDNL